MSAFANASFKANKYLTYRPTYPSSLFQYLSRTYHKTTTSRALDIGCGPGEATYALLPYFDKVIGIDPSLSMITTARTRIPEQYKDRVEFHQGRSDDLSHFPDDSFDIITCAECIHWFGPSYDEFFNEVRRILKPNGTFAFWGYVDPVFVGFEGADEVNKFVKEYMYEDADKLGPYWEQPGRGLLASCMEGIQPSFGFKDLKVFKHVPGQVLREGEEEIPLKINKKVQLIDYLMYTHTWSSYSSWRLAHQGEEDIAEKFYKELKQLTGWNDDTEVQFEFITFLTVSRKA